MCGAKTCVHDEKPARRPAYSMAVFRAKIGGAEDATSPTCDNSRRRPRSAWARESPPVEGDVVNRSAHASAPKKIIDVV